MSTLVAGTKLYQNLPGFATNMVRNTLLCTEPSCWPKVENPGLNANSCNNSRQLDTLMKNLIKIEFCDLSLVEKTLFCDMKQARSSYLNKTFGDISKWMQNFGVRRPKNDFFDFFQNHQKCYETCPQHQNNSIGMNFNGIGQLKHSKIKEFKN